MTDFIIPKRKRGRPCKVHKSPVVVKLGAVDSAPFVTLQLPSTHVPKSKRWRVLLTQFTEISDDIDDITRRIKVLKDERACLLTKKALILPVFEKAVMDDV